LVGLEHPEALSDSSAGTAVASDSFIPMANLLFNPTEQL
jgi:hypothetical protein